MLHRAATEAFRLATQAPTTRHLGAETGGLGGQNSRRQVVRSSAGAPRKPLTNERQRVLIDGGNKRDGGGNYKADGGQRTRSGWLRPSRINSRPLQTEQADGGDRNHFPRDLLAWAGAAPHRPAVRSLRAGVKSDGCGDGNGSVQRVTENAD